MAWALVQRLTPDGPPPQGQLRGKGERILGPQVRPVPEHKRREVGARGARAEGIRVMTEDKDFKKLIRSRMAKTGESFTTARSALLRASLTPDSPPAEPAWREAGAGSNAVRFRFGKAGLQVEHTDQRHATVLKWLRDNALDASTELSFALEEASLLETGEIAAVVQAARMPSMPLKPGVVTMVESVPIEAVRNGDHWLISWPVLLTEFELSDMAAGNDPKWRLRHELGPQCGEVQIHFIEAPLALITASVFADHDFAQGVRFEATRKGEIFATHEDYPGYLGTGPTKGAAVKDLRDQIDTHESDWRNQVDDDTAAYIMNQDDD